METFIPTATAAIDEMRTISALLQSASEKDAPPETVTLNGEAYMVALAILRANNSPEALKAVNLLEEGLMDFIMAGGE